MSEAAISLANARSVLANEQNLFFQRNQALRTQDILKEQTAEQEDTEINKSIEGVTDTIGGIFGTKGLNVGKQVLKKVGSAVKDKLLKKAESTAFRKGSSTAGRFLQDTRTKGLGKAGKNLAKDILERSQKPALRSMEGFNQSINNVVSGESDLGMGLNDSMNSWRTAAQDTVSNTLSDATDAVSNTLSDATDAVSNTLSDATDAVSNVSSTVSDAASQVGDIARTAQSDAANSIQSSITSIADESNGKLSGIARAVDQDGAHPFSSLNPIENIESATSAPVENPALDSAAEELHNTIKGDASNIARSTGNDVENAVGKAKSVERDFMNENWVDNTKLKDMDFSLEKYRYAKWRERGLDDLDTIDRDSAERVGIKAAKSGSKAAEEAVSGLDNLEANAAGSLGQKTATGAAESAEGLAQRAESTVTNTAGDLGQDAAKGAAETAEGLVQRAESTVTNAAGDLGQSVATGAAETAEGLAQSAESSVAKSVASDTAQKASQQANQLAEEASQRAEQVTSDVNRAGQSASDAARGSANVADRLASEAGSEATTASNIQDATSITSDLDDVVKGASDAAKTATEAATGGVESIEAGAESALGAVDAADQEIPGLDVVTDVATGALGLAMILGGSLFKTHANAAAQTAADKLSEAKASMESMPSVGIEFGNK